jgi:HAD superfamily hydrolase (TIGR01484 family)
MKRINEIMPDEAHMVKYILMDIDDTLTTEGKLSPSAYSALWMLHDAGLHVIPVTGRPAGWCDLIAREWPCDGVVGENGAFVFYELSSGTGGKRKPDLRQMFHPDAVRNGHPALRRIKERAFAEFSGLRMAKDQFARLFDIAIDFAEEEPVLPLSTAERIKEIAHTEGAMAKVSSIHVNVWMGKYDKLTMAERFLTERFGWRSGAGDGEVIFVGDSPNDEPMFARFPKACAVANVRRYEGLIKYLPAFVAEKECGEGFAEIAGQIICKTNWGKL